MEPVSYTHLLEKAIRSYEKHEKDADRFIALIDKYENFDTLTIAMLNEFIEKILVHERDRKGSIQTTQAVSYTHLDVYKRQMMNVRSSKKK